MNWYPHKTVATVVEKDNRFLMVEEQSDGKVVFNQPAGHLEAGETLFDAARRETLEETGAEITALEPYLLFDIPHIHQIYFMFRARLMEPAFHRTQESAQVRLFEAREIPWDEIAFPVIEKTLQIYLADRPSGEFPFQIHPILAKMKPD